jgi:hypothetical protein
MDIQSGIVLAVIIGAVLLVDRLGDTDELARRLFQVALGVAFAYFVFSGTTAFIRVAGNPSDSQILSGLGSNDSSGAARELANRFVAARAADFSVGVLAILFGIGGLRRWRRYRSGSLSAGCFLCWRAAQGAGRAPISSSF